MKNNHKIWRDDEIIYIKNNYGKILSKDIAKKLNVPVYLVTSKANKLGLKSFLVFLQKNSSFKIWNKKRIGKTWEEQYGEQKGKQMKKDMSKRRKGVSLSKKNIDGIKKAWENIELRNRVIPKILKYKKITNNEKKLLRIIEKNNLPFNFVGNGKVILNGFCPDFLSKNPKHIIELTDSSINRERSKRKIKVYSSLGYKTLFISNYMLRYEDKIVNTIKEFIK